MKRKFAVILYLLIAALCIAVFAGCKHNVPPHEPPSPDTTPVLKFDGATVDKDNKIKITVDKDVDSVKLTDKVTVKEGYTWKLYADKMGIVEIPTKIAANVLTSELFDGDNEFFILVTDTDGKETILYELTIFRNHRVTVYFVCNGQLVAAMPADTNTTRDVTDWVDTSNIANGYTFDYWKDVDGNRVTELSVEDKDITLTAQVTPKHMTVTLDANGGQLQGENTAYVTFNTTYKLAVPTRTGYDFVGWLCDDYRLTDQTGTSVEPYPLFNDITAVAKWEARLYDVALEANNPDCGTVTGAGKFAYGKNVTITAVSNNGHTWLGWYAGDTLVSNSKVYSFVMTDRNVSLQARWATYKYTTTTLKEDNYSQYEQNSVNCEAGATVKLTQPQLKNTWSTFIVWQGWFDQEGNRLTTAFEYSFTMPARDVSYTGKWTHVNVITNNNLVYYGSVSCNKQTMTVGDVATFTASSGSDNSTFIGWYDENGQLVSEDNDLAVTLTDADINLYPKWTMFKYTVYYVDLLSDNPDDASYRGSRAASAKADSEVTIKAPNKVWEVVALYDADGNLLSDTLPYTFTMPKRDVEMYLHCNVYYVKVENDNIEAGKAELNVGSYTQTNYMGQNYYEVAVGVLMTCKVTSNDGYVFAGWFDEQNQLVSPDKEYQFEMAKQTSLYTAKWLTKLSVAGEDITYNDQYTTNGTVTLRGGVDYSGKTTWYGWYDGDGQLLTTSYFYTIADPTDGNTYVATRGDFPVTVVIQPEGMGEYSRYRGDAVGDEFELKITPYKGYVFDGWYDGDTLLSTQLQASFMLETCEPRTITAKLSIDPRLNGFKFSAYETYCEVNGIEDNSVTKIVIPNVARCISWWAFSGCENLVEVVIPTSITKIEYCVFYGCDNLTTIIYEGTKAQWNSISKNSVWCGTNSLQKIVCTDGEITYK